MPYLDFHHDHESYHLSRYDLRRAVRQHELTQTQHTIFTALQETPSIRAAADKANVKEQYVRKVLVRFAVRPDGLTLQ